MAQIPMGNFGQAVAQPGQAIPVPRLDTTSGTEALESAASGAVAVAQRERQQVAAEQANAKAALSLATAQNALHDAHDTVARGVTDGTIPTDDAESEFKKQTAAIAQVSSQGLTQHHADILNAQITGTSGELQRSISGVVVKRRQSETAATVDQFGEQVQREALRNGPGWATEKYSTMLDFTGAAAGFTPEQIAAKKQAFGERSTWAYYDQKATDALGAGDMNGLTSQLHEVMGPAGDALDPVRRATLEHQIIGYQNHLLAKQAGDQAALDRLQEQRDKLAETSYQKAWQTVSEGKYLSQDAIDQLSEDTAHSPIWGKQAVALLSSQSQVAGFASMSADQRAAKLERVRAEAANPNVGTTPEMAHVVTLLDKIDTAARVAAKDDPWTAAQSYGVIKSAPAMDMADPNSLPQALDLRMQHIGAVETWVGHKVSPLQPREAEQLGLALKALPPAEAARTFSTIGQMVGDPDRIAAVAKQLGDHDGVMGLAMAYAGDRTEGGKLTSEAILRGQQAFKNKTVLDDSSKVTGWRSTAALTIGDAFSDSRVKQQAIDAAVYVAAANGGDIDAAIKTATGGIVTRGLGQIPLPVGVDEDAFDKRIRAITPATLAPQAPDGVVFLGRVPVKLDQFVATLPDATLVHAGQGLYNVRAGNTLATNARGQRITIKVGP